MKTEKENLMQYDRRLGIDRRSYNYSGYFPERRISNDRRSGVDRRNSDPNEQNDLERRSTD